MNDEYVRKIDQHIVAQSDRLEGEREADDHVLEVARQMYEDARSSDYKAYPEWDDAPQGLRDTFIDEATEYVANT